MKQLMGTCEKHGTTEFLVEKQNETGKTRLRCKKCGYERQLKAKRLRKKELVELAGGKCSMCGYNRYLGALDFHHLDPSEKEFEIGQGLLRYSKDKLIAEMSKCSLVCKNCHAEIEAGLMVCVV